VHLYSLGVPRVVNLLCEHALINAYVAHNRTIQPTVVEAVAREFQLDEVEPVAPPESLRNSAEMFSSEMFIQNLGEALSRFRMDAPATPFRNKK